MNTFIRCAVLVYILSLAAWVHGQATTDLLNQACGPMGTRFAVHEGSPQPSLSAPPKTGARIVVFVETIGLGAGCGFAPRVGLDSKWIGATCAGSYISVDVDPGKHRLCANAWWKNAAKYTALYSFTAEPGNVYYFRAEMIQTAIPVISTVAMHLEPVNEEEGHLLLAARNSSESKVK
jgi:hypothetical protein